VDGVFTAKLYCKAQMGKGTYIFASIHSILKEKKLKMETKKSL
jgi:hypothetical protein